MGRATSASTASKIGSIKDAVGLAVDECQSAYMAEYATNTAVKPGPYMSEKMVKKALNAQDYEIYKGGSSPSSSDQVTASTINALDASATTDTSGVKIGGASTAYYYVCQKGSTDGLEVKFTWPASDASGTTYAVKVEYGTKLLEVKTSAGE